MKRKTHVFLILAALWLMMFAASAQVIIVSPILPEIDAALNVPDAQLSWLMSVYAAALCLFALSTGPISDRIGRRRILLFGTMAMAGALWLHALADSFAMLLAMRALAGAAGGMLSGASVAFVGDYFPYERRGWANGWIMSGMAVGQIIGIPLGKVLANAFGYQWPFLVFAIAMTGAAFLVWRFVPQPEIELDSSKLNLASAFSGYLDLLRDRSVQAAVTSYFLMFLSLGLFIVYLPTWLESDVGLSGNQVALLFAIGGVANVIAGPAAGWFSDQVGRKPLIIGSCVGFGALMLVTTSFIVDMATAGIFYAVLMILVAMRISPLQSLLSALVPGARRGVLMSLAVGIGQLGIFGGSALAGVTYAANGYALNTYLGAAAILLMALLVWLALPEPDREAAGVRA